ncbi:MAG: cobalamin B12-binding domain-containing protein [Rubrivivax sp.]|nr:cobalamin B12-binding domain-containing protein [Rubrivivax sp.]
MQGDQTGGSAASESQARQSEWANEEPTASWPDTAAGRVAAKDRLARLARTIETDVIPRLVQAHRPGAANPQPGSAVTATADVDGFVELIIHGTEADAVVTIDTMRERGVAIESIYLDLFAPTARRLGLMWEDDSCDFSTVTVALGRLQRLLRELSPAFGTEIEHPANGRRALFVQPRDEQHSFGLSMVAEFFRRDGWDVIGGVGGAVASPQALVRDEWIDVIGFSVGSDGRLPWLCETITAVRAASRNPTLGVLVGGPPFVDHPERATECGADGTARNGKEAPLVAERLLSRSRLRKA